MSSTKTIEKVKVSSRTTKGEKDIRKEVMEEMKSKEQEIKDLKDLVMRLKVQKNEVESIGVMNMNMSLVRKEISIADKFIKEVMKSNLPNYELISEMANDGKVKKDKEEKERNLESFKRKIKDNHMTFSCQCEACNMNKLWMKTRSFLNQSSFSSSFNLTDRVGMAAHYDSTDVNMEVTNEDEKTKKVTFRRKSNNISVVSLRFIWRKDAMVSVDSLKFNNHMEVATLEEVGNGHELVSMSAYLIVKAMRELPSNQLEELEKSKVLMDNKDKKETCFSSMIRELSNGKILCENATKMSDLREEDEMYLITNFSDRKVFFKVHNESKVSSKNHISTGSFEDCKQTSLVMLSTPLMRNVNFFNSNLEDMSEVNSPKSTPTMSEDDESSREETMIMMEDKVKQYKEKLKALKYSIFGNLTGDFNISLFKSRNSKDSILPEIIDMCSKSKLAVNSLSKSGIPIHWLMVANMSYRSFLMIAFFARNLIEVMELSLINSPESIFMTWRNLPIIFIHFFKDLGGASRLSAMFEDLMSYIAESKEYNTVQLRKLFWMMKERMYNIIIMKEVMNSSQYELNEKFNKNDEGKNRFMRERSKSIQTMMMDSDYSLMSFWPTDQETEIRKNMVMQAQDLDVDLSNSMMEEMHRSNFYFGL